MAFADYDAWLAAKAAPHQRFDIAEIKTMPSGTDWTSMWTNSAGSTRISLPSTPGASAACTRSSAGALGQTDAASGDLFAWLRSIRCGKAGTAPGLFDGGMLMLADRLVEMGGLSGTSVAAQPVATAALTRYTDGVGVLACAEIYTAIGTTATTITLDYTDDDGNPSQTSTPTPIGGATRNQIGKMIPLSLAVGDRGVSAVNTATLAASTVSAAGNFGITLLKPLLVIPAAVIPHEIDMDPITFLGGYLPKVEPGACLQLLWLVTGQSAMTHSLSIHLGEA